MKPTFLPRHILTAATLCVLAWGQAQAQDVPPAIATRIKLAIETNSQSKVHVDGVAKTPIPSVYEITSGSEVFYADETGSYAFVDGRLVDLRTQKDLTASRLERLQAVDFNDLPLQHAIKEVRGNGKRKVAIFEDPNCPICRVFHKFAAQLDDVTVYKFMFPVIDPASAGLAKVAWCSNNRAQVWESIMNGARPQGKQDCDTRGLVAILKTGEKYQINNTPTVILGNGKRLVGATPPEQFIAELDASLN